MDIEFFFLLENVVTIILGLAIFAVGFRLKDRLYSEEARQRPMDNWRRYSIGVALFGGPLFIYLIAELSRFMDQYYPNLNLEDVHEWGDMGGKRIGEGKRILLHPAIGLSPKMTEVGTSKILVEGGTKIIITPDCLS